MSVHSNVLTALLSILETKQPIAARALIEAMRREGHNSVETRRAIQLAFERGYIKLDQSMRVVIAERELAAA